MIDSGRHRVLLLRLFAAACLMVASAGLFAQDVAVSLPSHAQASRYGGWDCVRGYAQIGKTCIAVRVPANGYLDSSGDDWACDRGYVKVDAECKAIKVPTHAYADNSGFAPGWHCN